MGRTLLVNLKSFSISLNLFRRDGSTAATDSHVEVCKISFEGLRGTHYVGISQLDKAGGKLRDYLLLFTIRVNS